MNQREGRIDAPAQRPRRRRQRAVAASMLLAAIATAAESPGQTIEADKANKVKVAYLYNFSRYIAWPEAAFADGDAPFVIGVLGEDPFGRRLDRLTRSVMAANARSWSSDLPPSPTASRATYSSCRLGWRRSSVWG